MTLDKHPRAEKLVVRGTMLLLMAPSLFLLGVACIAFSIDNFRTLPRDTADTLEGLGAAAGALIFLWMSIRSARGGIRADSHGVQIRNIWSTHFVPWDEVKGIVIHHESDEGVGAYNLRILLAKGYVASTYPEVWGSDKPLERPRLALLRLRDDS